MSCLLSLGGWEVYADGQFRKKDGAGNVSQIQRLQKTKRDAAPKWQKKVPIRRRCKPRDVPRSSLAAQCPEQGRDRGTPHPGAGPLPPSRPRPHSRGPRSLAPLAEIASPGS